MRSRPRVTVVPSFSDAVCQMITATSHDTARFFTTPTHIVLYATTARETFVSAERWHRPVAAVVEFMHQEGPDYSYSSPAAFAFSLWTKRFAPAGYVLPGPDFCADLCRKAYYGGRCEVYNYLDDTVAHQYDMTGAYPYASTQLTFPDPRSLRYAKPPSIENIWMYEGVSRVEFTQDGDYPILPIRYGGRVLYPHCDHATGTYTHTELRYALHHFPTSRIHAVTKQYIAQRTMEPNPFSAFCDYCYERRVQTGDKLWKVVANALFGRLGIDGEGLWSFTPTTDLAKFRTQPTDSRGFFGVYCTGSQSPAPARGNVLWTAMVLAQARCALHSQLAPDVAYVDTDCVFCTSPRDLPLSAALGGWKYKYGRYTVRGTQAYERVDLDTGEILETKLRGVPLAHRQAIDFLRARETQERRRLPDGRTVPHVLENPQNGDYARC